MKRWLRRVRGAVGMGVVWGLAWFGAGMVLLLIVGLDAADVEIRLAALDRFSLSMERLPDSIPCRRLVARLTDGPEVRTAARAALARVVREGKCIAAMEAWIASPAPEFRER